MQLRDYQIATVEQATQILYDRWVCLLALEPRLGKTFCSLTVAERIGAKRVLFVTPKKAIPSIYSDYEQLKRDNPCLFDLTIINPEAILSADKKADRVATDIVARTYPTVSKTGIKFKRLQREEKQRQTELLMPYLTGDGIDLIIIDECHRMGAYPKPSGAQKVLRTIAKGKRVLLLSGTPNPESHSMFYHEFQISDHSPWADIKTFYFWAKSGYVNITSRPVNGLPIVDYSDGNQERILADIAPYTISLTQQEAGFETVIDERFINVQMQPDTLRLIKNLKRDRVVTVNGIDVAAGSPADYLNKIHQLTGGTIKTGETEHVILDATKADYLRDTFHGRHYAIFYVYKAERELLLTVLGQDTITEDWQVFQADRSKIFIGQIRSVREGLRLDSADFSVFYSMEYSYVSYAQGRQRIVSKERDTPAIVYFFTSNCRMEQLILDCVHDKQDFTLSVYGKATKRTCATQPTIPFPE